MRNKIRFESLQAAEKVVEHLYNVQVDATCLVFSDFDEEAFELAVALEGLQEKDYEYVIDSNYNHYVERALRNLALDRIANPQATAWMGGYKVNIDLLKIPDDSALLVDPNAFLFRLSSNLGPRLSLLPCGAKELSIEITVDNEFRQFIFILKQLINTCLTLLGEIDRAVLTAKNLHTRDVQYFLTIFCGSQSQIIQFYPVNNNITIERF